jgi:hypothetical protein
VYSPYFLASCYCSIFITMMITEEKKYQQPILIYTNDCLNDYLTLKTSGIHFIDGPCYTPEGLVAEFTDKQGNSYKILERRFYEIDQ